MELCYSHYWFLVEERLHNFFLGGVGQFCTFYHYVALIQCFVRIYSDGRFSVSVLLGDGRRDDLSVWTDFSKVLQGIASF